MRRREFIALLGGALAGSMAAAARARAQQQPAPQNGSAPAQRAAQVVPQPVPQVTPQLNVPGPQMAPSRPGNPVQQLAPLHSITSSARASSVGGISRPIALAVLRLIASSYFVGCISGRFAGFSPLRVRPT